MHKTIATVVTMNNRTLMIPITINKVFVSLFPLSFVLLSLLSGFFPLSVFVLFFDSNCEEWEEKIKLGCTIHDMHHCNVFWRPNSWLVVSDVKSVNTSLATNRLLGQWCNVKWCMSWIVWVKSSSIALKLCKMQRKSTVLMLEWQI